MMHSLAARALIMMADFGCNSTEAVVWVCRRIPATLRGYYQRNVVRLVACEFVPEVMA